MPDQLSMFEDHEVVSNALGVSGTVKDPVLQPLAELPLHSRVVLLVVGSGEHVGFSAGPHDRQAVREQKVKVAEAYDLAELGVDVEDMVTQLRALNEEALAERMAERPREDFSHEDAERALETVGS